jgi:hypothetical protein
MVSRRGQGTAAKNLIESNIGTTAMEISLKFQALV